MFSYRHAFHAGNHADVLKHAVLLHVLNYFQRKDAPYWVIDTHAGAGHYRLDSAQASQTAEWREGLGRLWSRSDAPPMLADYLAQLSHYQNQHNQNQHNEGAGGARPDEPRYYPGSPWLALAALRPRERLRLFELHPSESSVLAANLAHLPRAQQRQVACYAADGFSGLNALLPPPTRRGLILIDPSYEDKRDYRRVQDTLRAGLTRFATGCYVIWYPQVARREAAALPGQMAKLAARWLHASLTVRRAHSSGHGLYGSGVFVINPPWTLAAALAESLPWLARVLAQDGHAGYQLEARDGAQA